MCRHAGQNTLAPIVEKTDEYSEEGKGNQIDRLHVVKSEDYSGDEQTLYSERPLKRSLKISAEEGLLAYRGRNTDDDDQPKHLALCVRSEDLLIDLCKEIREIQLPQKKLADVTTHRYEENDRDYSKEDFHNRHRLELDIRKNFFRMPSFDKPDRWDKHEDKFGYHN